MRIAGPLSGEPRAGRVRAKAGRFNLKLLIVMGAEVRSRGTDARCG